MKALISLAVLTLISDSLSIAGAQELEWVSDTLGEYIIVPMKNAPFPHKSRERGHAYENTTYTFEMCYSDSSVGILIPAGYEKKDTVDLIVHYHGHLNTVAKEIEEFQLRQQLKESGHNLIMILPQGPKNARDSTCGKIEDPNGLRNLVLETLNFLHEQGKIRTQSLGSVILSGHSGGYRPIAFSLDVGGLDSHIKEVYLMDAAYANLTSYSSWAARSQGRLISIFTDHLMGENLEIMRDLQKQNVDHFSVLLDEDVTTETLKRNRITFIHTKLDHFALMYQTHYLARFMVSGK